MVATNGAGVAAAGRKIYHEQILPTLGPEDSDKLVAIDVHSGDYEIDADDMEALRRLFERYPEGHAWLERVGHAAAYHMGSLLASELP